MERYAPSAKDLASRDVVSRAMTVEIAEGRGVGPDADHIFLHLDHLDASVLHARLPGISETAKVFAGVDVAKQPIPVIPTVHYNMGGIPTNYHGEVVTLKNGNPDTVVPGLMAIGEAGCVSVHGANRLGSNSLLDLVVFGRAAAHRAKDIVKKGVKVTQAPASATEKALHRFDSIRYANGAQPTATIRKTMQRTMQNHAAVFRTQETLAQGVKKMSEVYDSFKDVKVSDRGLIFNSDLLETLELDNLRGQSLVTVVSAENRKESRGAHSREDFTERDDANWMKHSICWLEDSGKTKMDYRPVHTKTLTSDVEYVAPKKRVY
jgi:succinate dehydrogenase / fumarate reductase flavoprotein subunit